jgi:hypothetical protein
MATIKKPLAGAMCGLLLVSSGIIMAFYFIAELIKLGIIKISPENVNFIRNNYGTGITYFLLGIGVLMILFSFLMANKKQQN